jgi:voltage-gated potassium channel
MNRNTFFSALGKHLPIGLVTRIKMLWERAYRMLRMDMWFPHVPLALLVGLSGLIQLLPSMGSVSKFISFLAVSTEEFDSLSQGFDTLAIRGVSLELIGGLLIVLSFGLLRRSRLAWVVTLFMTAATLGLEFMLHEEPRVSIIAYSSTLLVLLFLARRSFDRASLAAGTMFALIGVVLTMGYGVLGSYVLGSGFSPKITDFGSAFYFTVVTMSTVGYGDITPHTLDARLFTSSLIVFGIVVFATSLTAVAGPLINQQMMHLLQPRKRLMKRKNHIIVVGDNTLARNAIKALGARGIPVTAIWDTRPPEGSETPEDLIVGDGGDIGVLQSAGVMAARTVLALSNDDSENAFVALAAKDASEKVRTVVAVSNARNMTRVGHVRPDAVLALPVIGGELLAMALSGEEIKMEELLHLA